MAFMGSNSEVCLFLLSSSSPFSRTGIMTNLLALFNSMLSLSSTSISYSECCIREGSISVINTLFLSFGIKIVLQVKSPCLVNMDTHVHHGVINALVRSPAFRHGHICLRTSKQ